MSSNRKWIDMMWTKVGDGEVGIYRTKKPGTEERMSGYGYFLQLRFKTREGEDKGKEIKLPLRLAIYLKQKLAEFRIGTFYVSPAFSTDDADFALVKYMDVDPCVQLQVTPKHSSSGPSFLTMALNDFIKLTMCMDVLGLLITRQKTNTTKDAYGLWVKEVVGWCTAKRSHLEAQRILGSEKIASEDQLMGLMAAVKSSRYHHFYQCLSDFINELKVRIPIHAETSEYDEDFVRRGFLYTTPEHLWEPVQLLVNMIHDTEFEKDHFADCC